jgi:hypothetical protein
MTKTQLRDRQLSCASRGGTEQNVPFQEYGGECFLVGDPPRPVEAYYAVRELRKNTAVSGIVHECRRDASSAEIREKAAHT